MKLILLPSRVDHPQMIQVKILQRNEHGATPSRCICVFKLKSIAFTVDHHQKIQLGAGMSCPISLKIIMSSYDFQGLSWRTIFSHDESRQLVGWPQVNILEFLTNRPIWLTIFSHVLWKSLRFLRFNPYQHTML